MSIVGFAWPLRARVVLSDCRLGERAVSVELTGRAEQALELRLDALELLRDQTGALLFEPFAAADESGDADITLEELSAAPGAAPSETLLQELYRERLPRIAGVAGGTCTGRIETCEDDCDDH